MIKSIVVLGGGSAGWLTACLIAAKHVNENSPFSVTLVESPNIPTIGVGEGTWPTMVNTLQQIGISELTFIQRCDASFKQASKFVNWVNNKPGDEYYHPFTPPQSFDQISLGRAWQQQYSDKPFAETVCLQALLCQQKRAPKQLNLGDFKTIENYGYHLNASKFSQLLTEHGTEKLSVKHILDDVIAVKSKSNGDIASLTTKEHGDINGDLFIDCSGQAAALIGKHYQVPFISKKEVLFIDKAITVQVPYPCEKAPVESATISTAQSAGWIWDIGLPNRRGVGHVFSTKYTTIEAATAQLKSYLAQSVDNIEQLTFRTLDINPGYRATFWHKNCVAVGMSSGFLEPLEASALVMVELAAKTLALQMPASREAMDVIARQYNKNMTFRWQRIIDFLKLHYVLSKRGDSDFWRDNRDPATIPDSLKELLTLWQYQPPENNGFLSPYDLFPAASYQYILYGMGFNTQVNCLGNETELAKLSNNAIEKVKSRQRKMPALLPTNREILTQINQLNREITIDITQENLPTSQPWQYVPNNHLSKVSQQYPVFFKKTTSGYSPIYLTHLTDQGKLLHADDINRKRYLENTNATTLLPVNDDELLEPVKLDIRLNDDTAIKVTGLYVFQQIKWQQFKSSQQCSAKLTELVELTMSSLQHVSRLIAKENKARNI
ncbi:tryptophan halogenase family protein [Thalassotalea castellviae]|uniref:Tryptophan halogenase family protein n=1 Tax=Thalassotalea castellviae TaxID=3075612 RepID=A0ABU3A2F6_9GAMM|nr:tryptophan halogenase family protein [Thalassotalea sp. W431]MDT0604357.1 tryptophan halogenase family protein [Thalassotalea sp. W431]